MTMTRLWTLIAVIAVIVILGGGYAVGVGPALTAASDSDQQLADVELQNQIKNTELVRLKGLAKDSAELFGQLEELQLAIPATHNTSVFAAQLAALAAAAEVTLNRVSYVSAEPALAPESEATPAVPVDGEEPAADAGAPAAVEPGSDANTLAVPSVPGLVALAVSIEVEGSDLAIHQFLASAQEAIRAFSVSTVSFDQGEQEGTFALKIDGYVYVLPGANVPLVSSDGETAS
ncbi:MAG: hypothetical protein ACOH14_13935 [Rhodoglobus sp.]